MRKLLIAALLGSYILTAPASASIMLDYKGSGEVLLKSYSAENYSITSVNVQGTLEFCGICESDVDQYSFTFKVDEPHIQRILWGVMNFTFDAPVAYLFTGEWISGSGIGEYAVGDNDAQVLSEYYFTVSRVRFYQNDDYNPLGSMWLSAVPEPATWALMIGGFALAGAAMRRRTMAVAFT